MDARKQAIVVALQRFIAQRPGLEFGNYGDVSAYRSEMRGITKNRHQAETLLSSIMWRDSIGADELIAAAKHSFSGRLSITERDDGRVVVDYCVGQYGPTEYRRAACAVLSSALWEYWRKDGNDPRKLARQEFGRGIAAAWFN